MSQGATVNMFWHGGPLPPLAWACMRSFARLGHRLRVFSYHDLALPDGVAHADAGDILDADGRLEDYKAIADFSDIFRYKLLHEQGGWWVDTDVFCLAGDLPPEPYSWAEQEAGIINNAILKFPAGDPLCRDLLAAAVARRGRRQRWGALGSDLVTEVLAPQRGIAKSGSTAAFYPWRWQESFLLWLPRGRAEIEQRIICAQFMHFWGFSLRMMNMDPYRDPPAHSFWAQIIENCPNRVAEDALYRRRTEKGIRHFIRRHWKREHWKAYLQRAPELFAMDGGKLS
jgi:hypothetical protein